MKLKVLDTFENFSMKDEREVRLEVLIHESQQVHDALGRTLASTNALFGAVLPVAVGFLLYTAGKEDKAVPLDVLYRQSRCAPNKGTLCNGMSPSLLEP